MTEIKVGLRESKSTHHRFVRSEGIVSLESPLFPGSSRTKTTRRISSQARCQASLSPPLLLAPSRNLANRFCPADDGVGIELCKMDFALNNYRVSPRRTRLPSLHLLLYPCLLLRCRYLCKIHYFIDIDGEARLFEQTVYYLHISKCSLIFYVFLLQKCVSKDNFSLICLFMHI